MRAKVKATEVRRGDIHAASGKPVEAITAPYWRTVLGQRVKVVTATVGGRERSWNIDANIGVEREAAGA